MKHALSLAGATLVAALTSPAHALSFQRHHEITIGDVAPGGDADHTIIPFGFPPFIDALMKGGAVQLYGSARAEVDGGADAYAIEATAFTHLQLSNLNVYPVWTSAWARVKRKDLRYDAMFNASAFDGPAVHEHDAVPVGFSKQWPVSPFGKALPQQMIDLGALGKLYFEVSGGGGGLVQLDAQPDRGSIDLDFSVDIRAHMSLVNNSFTLFDYGFTLVQASAHATSSISIDWIYRQECASIHARGSIVAFKGDGIPPYIPAHEGLRVDRTLFDEFDCTSF